MRESKSRKDSRLGVNKASIAEEVEDLLFSFCSCSVMIISSNLAALTSALVPTRRTSSVFDIVPELVGTTTDKVPIQVGAVVVDGKESVTVKSPKEKKKQNNLRKK